MHDIFSFRKKEATTRAQREGRTDEIHGFKTAMTSPLLCLATGCPSNKLRVVTYLEPQNGNMFVLESSLSKLVTMFERTGMNNDKPRFFDRSDV